jgi:uncharacterized YigZ family protein
MAKIVYKEGSGEIVEKKSRFIAYIFPAETEEEALTRIAQIRKKHYDARHNCFAYVIGDDRETKRCSDDGEPSGTAGRPMLEVLTGMEIHNTVAIVTRYFGGTLLGTGGLVRAYTAAMKEGLAACVLMEEKTGYKVSIRTDYNDFGKIQYLARAMELTELDTLYSDDVEMILLVPEEIIDKMEHDITEKTAGKTLIERQDKLHYGITDGNVVLL